MATVARLVLVIGGSGFVGRHVLRACVMGGLPAVGTFHRTSPQHAVGDEKAEIAWERVDIGDPASVRVVLDRWRPIWLIVLAAQSSVAAASGDVGKTLAVNVLGPWNVFSAARSVKSLEKIVWVGSGEAYGHVAGAADRCEETMALQPITVYGLSKAAADGLAAILSRRGELPIVRARLFPCTGPGQSSRFVCGDFAQQIALAERRGEAVTIRGGNLDVVRDFTDVRDVADALLALLQHGQVGEAYNVCSGIGRSVREVAESLLRVAGCSGNIVSEASKRRPVDIARLVGSPEKIAAATGWLPRRPWEQTLKDLLADWRVRVRANSTDT
ncbi:MAG: GDP-mannose 4,6-dehydratase [Candidatus Binatia bacterium]|nr:MAG: GDP-mannose 4,6-dehydratase [Candidatus Binatia bacterium]